MSDKQKHICETCRWWTSHAYKDEYSLGLCHVSPGAIEVNKDEWCSQWQAKPVDVSKAQDFGEPQAGDTVSRNLQPEETHRVFMAAHGYLVVESPGGLHTEAACNHTVIARPPLKPGDIVERKVFPEWGYGRVARKTYEEDGWDAKYWQVAFGDGVERLCRRDHLRRLLCAKESQE